MKIEKTILIEFDEHKERDRILRTWSGKKKQPIREWLIAMLDAFIAQDWDKASDYCRNKPDAGDDNALEYVHGVIFDVLKQMAEAKTRKAAFEQLPPEKQAVRLTQLAGFSGTPTGPDRFDYPKFRVLSSESA